MPATAFSPATNPLYAAKRASAQNYSRLQSDGLTRILTRASSALDLRNQQTVANFFASERAEHVLLAAAKVGGIYANDAFLRSLISENLAIQSDVIDIVYPHGMLKLLFLGSSFIYPKLTPHRCRRVACWPDR